MVSVGDNWNCPFCGHAQVVIDPRVTKRMETLYLKGWKLGEPKIELVAVVCANEACKQLTLTAEDSH